jgi:type I restriction enzyme S subunit
MTPEQLKASILQYAIQGKLVEQRPEEGTGEELYRQIQAEKQRLIKEGKIKKEKALPEIAEDEIPFDLPDSWKWVRLNAVIVLLSGSDLTPNKYNNSCKGIPYITGASNIEGEKLVINRWTEYPNNIAHNGDLLLTCKGTVGKTTILNEPEVHIARQLMAITAIELNLKYLKYFVESHVDVLKAKAKSLIPGIERDNVLKLLLPLPPLAEQHRIVAKIEELLPYVDRYAAAYEKLEQFNAKFPEDMKKSILQYAIQGKLVEQRPEEGTGKELYRQIQEEKKRLIKEGTIKKEKPLAEIAEDEIPFDIPENWKWVQLGNLASINGGFAFKSTNYTTEGVRVIRISDFNETGFVNDKIVRYPYDDSLSQYVLDVKNILLCMTGGTVGKSLFITKLDEKMVVNQRVATIKVESVLPEYVYQVILAPITQKVIQDSKNSTNDNISMDTIKSFLIPLPPLAEQKRIVAKLEEILPLCERLK